MKKLKHSLVLAAVIGSLFLTSCDALMGRDADGRKGVSVPRVSVMLMNTANTVKAYDLNSDQIISGEEWIPLSLALYTQYRAALKPLDEVEKPLNGGGQVPE